MLPQVYRVHSTSDTVALMAALTATAAQLTTWLVERAGLQSYFGHPDNLSEGLNSGKSLTGKAGSE